MALYGYPITQGQKNAIVQVAMNNGIFFNPVQDVNGTWFIFEMEKRFAEENFGWKLTLTEFVPYEPNIDFDENVSPSKK